LTRAFQRCADGLYRFILIRAGGDRDTADDLLQQVCVEAAKCRRIFPNDGECEAFLFGIARNLVRKHWRRMRGKGIALPAHDSDMGTALAEQMEAGPLPPETLTQRESVTQLMLAITALTPADQYLVRAFYFDGRPQVEIAAEIGLTPKGVESRLYRVRTRLRAMLREQENQP
jgi:RNA polymerase sigma-70 factor (ECF subfamily)